jgi:VCBS repeat protein
MAKIHFVVLNERCTNFAIYFDTVASGRGKPRRYAGLVGDGDYFREGFGRREIAPSHFDAMADLDGDGDLDLFKGGVEPFVYCYENVGGNRFVERGRLTSGGVPFKLPYSRDNRSWVTVAFYDLDGDGDQDFFPSFGDGPDAGTIIFYRNSDRMSFERVGPLRTTSGTLLAGGAQAGGWFPSIVFVRGWDGHDPNRLDALVGSNHRCWLYRGTGNSFADAVAVEAGGAPINLTNPRFEVADIDEDGDMDLFAGTQPGPVYLFENIGTRYEPLLAKGRIIAWQGNYLIGDAHSGIAIADFNGDRRLDILSGRFWERTDLNRPHRAHDFGGFFRNEFLQFVRDHRTGPFTEQFQMCDSIRQNSVRATDWDSDGKRDLLSGDTDGFIWLFRNRGETFATGDRLPVSVTNRGGHVRLDVADWNNDGRRDLIVASGSGTVTVFLNGGTKRTPVLSAQLTVPIQIGARASLLVCDWNNDGRKDLVLADEKGYYVSTNIGTDSRPLLAEPAPILFGGRKVSYVRPNLGSFVDWDGDGRKDLIGCHFENSIRFYKNIGSPAEPQFADPEGVIILKGESLQMISGADVVDWNGDGDLDLLTGQGHGGSGLRFYERDWLENELAGTQPVVTVLKVERK